MKKFRFGVILLVSIFALPWFSYDLDDGFLDYESYDDRPSYVPWEFIIKYKSPSNTRWTKNTISVEDIESELQSSLDDDQDLKIIDTIPNFNMAVVSVEWNQNAQNIIDVLESNDNIEYAQPNYIYYVESIDTNDPWADFLRWLDNEWQEVNGVVWTAWEDIDRVKMWNTFSGSLSSSGPGSVVWVIDMWINYNHEDLKDQMRTNWNWYHWYDFVHNDNEPMPEPVDSHWTHVAGTIAAKMNNWKWMIWVNPNAKIASLMAWEDGHLETDDIISAVNYAIENGIKILNASYWSYDPDTSAYEAYARFRNSWWLLVASAWNKWIDVDETPHYPSGYELDNIISVAATQSDGNMRYNYWANSVDVGAPWVNIYSASVSPSYEPTYYMDFRGLSFDELESIWFRFEPSKEYFGHTTTANNFRFYADLTPNWAYLESPSIDISNFYWRNLYIGVANTCGNLSSEDSDWLWLEIDTWAGYSEVKKFWEGTFNSVFKIWYNESNNMKYRFVFHKNENPTQFSCWLRLIMIPWLIGWPNDYYSFKNWTSMASPHVSWLASLVWMFRPDLTAQEVRQAIMNNWDPLPSLDWKTASWKRINAYNTLFALDNYDPTKPEGLSPNWITLKEYTTPTFQRSESTDRWVWVEKYVFQLATSSSFDSNSLITEKEIDTNQLDYSISTINPTWTYYWRVRAVDVKWNVWDFSDTASFGYNIIPPIITVSGPESWWKKSKTVSANVTDSEVATTMWYTISDTNNCSSLSYSQSYTIWSSISLDSESYNSKYVCFKAESIWWTSYQSSNVIDKIDTTQPTITITQSNPTEWSQSKTITASANEGTLTMSEWSSTTCDSSRTFTTYTSKTYSSESDNNKYICYKAVDPAWNESYKLSAKVEKIDATAPSIAFDKNSWTAAKSHTVTITVTDNSSQIKANQSIKYRWQTSDNCSSTASDYTSLALSPSSISSSATASVDTSWLNDGSYYLCILAWFVSDVAWNTNAAIKTTWQFVVDNNPPTITINQDNPTEWSKSKTITASANEGTLTMSEWTSTTCDSSRSFTTYASKTYSSESDNNRYICYKAEDAAWNVTYKLSAKIEKIDTSAPTGWSFKINNGDSYTKNKTVTLNTECANDSWEWTVYVAYGNSENPTNWQACSPSISHTLSDWDGNKTVYIKFKDWLWNATDNITNTIILDATAPTLKFTDDVSATYVQNDTVTVNWWDATVKKYMYTTTNTCPATASSYIDTTSTNFDQTAEINNGKYICLYAEDALWNPSTKISGNAIHIDKAPPTGWSFTINNDATYSNTTSVTLNTNCATDSLAWNVQVAYGDSPNPDNWTACSSSLAFDLSAPDWTKTVYMRFKDWAENTTTDISKSIILDATAPSLSADNSESWKASSFDISLSVSDVNGLDYSYYSRTSAEDCINSWVPFTNWTKISYSTEWTSTLYLCAKDNAWNTNTWDGTYKIDTVNPTISFDKENGAIAKSHSVVVTASDTTSKLAGSQKISYKWSTIETCWTEWFTELAINPATAGSETATATISTDWLNDGSYYLCILWWSVSDQAGNKNVAAKTSWVFEIDNTPPSLDIQYSAMNVCTNSDIVVGIAASDVGSWIPTDWYSRNNTSAWSDTTEITLTENWNWTVYVKDNVWNIAQIQYNVDWIDKTVPTLEPINVTWPECTLLEWGVTVNDTLCWANNIVCNRSEFWVWTTTSIFPYKLMWIWTKTWIVMARDWAWNESSSVEVTYTWTDTLPTLEFPNYGYNTSITTTKSTKIWNIVQIMWAIDWDCWNWPEYINATSVSCTNWSGKLENNALFVSAPSNSEWVSICTITFVDDEGNSIIWNIAYNYNTKSTWWSWWGGWGWGWWWGGWGWSSSSSNSSEKSWIEKVIEMKNLIHEDDSVKWDSSADKSEDKSDLTDNTSTEDLGHASYSDDSGEDDAINMDNNLINIKINDKSFWYMTWNQWEVMPNWFSRELSNAYHFSYTNWITTMNSIYSANMNWLLSRIAMAKMLSIYAVNVLWKTPDTSKVPNFNDVNSKLDNDYNKWVTLAYQLWIMWQNMPNNLFRPYDLVTRAEFATALSRLLYWTKDWLDSYYSTHLNKLRKEWIISNTDPRMREVRWYVMLMLMRSAIK